MAARPKEEIWIETDAGRFDRFQSIEVSTDLFGEAQATIQIADDRAWRTLADTFAPGQNVAVYCSGLLVFTGRVEDHELPVDADSGTVIQVVLRTRLADARLAGADPNARVSNTTIKDFVLALYRPIGFTEADFLFTPETDRDLVTGRKAGKLPPVDLEPFKADQAKVLPTETIEAAAKRHLERHHLMQWETATGLLAVGLPNDEQPPFYRFEQRRGVCNFTSARPVRDWGEIPSEMWIYGGAVGKDVTRAPVKGVSLDFDLVDVGQRNGNFRRRVILSVEGAKDQARADAQARRELAVRSRRKAAWEIDLSDWSFWDGYRATPFAINTVADFDIEQHTGTDLAGLFLVTSAHKTLDVDGGTRCTLRTMKKGLINPLSNP